MDKYSTESLIRRLIMHLIDGHHDCPETGRLLSECKTRLSIQ